MKLQTSSCDEMIKRVVLAGFIALPFLAPAAWQQAQGPLKTRWAKEVSAGNALPEYPRPQMVRKEWINLNGLWDLAITPKDVARPQRFETQILVPFCVESAISGVMKRVTENERIWYRRTFEIPKGWQGRRVLLHFGAVDFETTVLVNGRNVGQHRGGYDPFTFDITDTLSPLGANEIEISVWDPTDAGAQPRGKQIRNPHGIWYTPASGIWQTVWLEPVSASHITEVKLTPDIDRGSITVEPVTTARLGQYTLEARVHDNWRTIYEASVTAGSRMTLPVKNAKLWSPEHPHLYGLTVTLKLGGRTIDKVESYFGMRKISLGKDEKGFTRMLLNNKPYFQFGPLDQGFWPDGIYTAPTDKALRYDIEMTKQLGFNMARKHVKVEPERWYYWCDKLGLLVWQDMPSGDKYIRSNEADIKRSPESAKEFEEELTALVQAHANHPCIVMWVPYNEGWGQWDTARIAEMVKRLDPTRLVDSASGWTDRAVGDVNDMHKYPGPGAPEPEQRRAIVLGEFGGLGLPVRRHTWQAEKNWGYRSFTDAPSLTRAYIDLIAKLFPLIEEKGLSAAVYTQTTDVEIEVNGLMTYDRELVKMNEKQIAAANRGQFAPRQTSREVVPSAQTERAQWLFTVEQPAADWFKPGFKAGNWKQAPGGFGTRSTPGSIVRTEWTSPEIWLRRDFSIENGNSGNLRLTMHHDEDVEVYINGVLAAKALGFTTDYDSYDIAPEAKATLKSSGNVMAIHCRQTAGGQYIDAGLIKLETPQK